MSRTRTHVCTSFTGVGMAPTLCDRGPALRAVALLELLARAAPARIVAADLLGRLGRVAVRGHAHPRAARGLRQRARLLGADAAGVGHLPGARGAAARRRGPRLVLLGRR